jgi:hypothetical protein
MTTAEMVGSGLVSFEVVKEIVGYMVNDNINQIHPIESEGKYYNEMIEEILLDEEGNVFILLADNGEPVMLPHLVEAVGY